MLMDTLYFERALGRVAGRPPMATSVVSTQSTDVIVIITVAAVRVRRAAGLFQRNNIPKDKWGQILGRTGAFPSLVESKVPKSMTEVMQQMEKKKK